MLHVILITGLSGTGKSTALHVLEDNGYYCIDNLPPPLLYQLLQDQTVKFENQKVAVSVDSRSLSMLQQIPNIIDKIKTLDINLNIIFLDARDDVIISRFAETRRKHPLFDNNKTIADCINYERNILSRIMPIVHKIDTSNLMTKDLNNILKEYMNSDYSQPTIIIQSFGFKYGVPIDSDFMFDVRCLPNPYYNSKIRNFTGVDLPITQFLEKEPIVGKMLQDIFMFLNTWLKKFTYDNRACITVSIGCTGGKHRSVYIANKLATLINDIGYKIIIRHRNSTINQKNDI